MAQIFTFSTFGYEGSLVTVEADIRHGIPSIDIVGLADGCVAETRLRVRNAITNSGLEFPMERILVALSPADVRKTEGFDLSIALAVLNENKESGFIDESVLVMGELGMFGGVIPVKGIHASVTTAAAFGIRYAVVPKSCEKEAQIEGMKVLAVESLSEAVEKMKDVSNFKEGEPLEKNDGITFPDADEEEIKVINRLCRTHPSTMRALAVAVAGRHHILLSGALGCGKTLAAQHSHLLAPNMTFEESQITAKIYSLAGLTRSNEPFIKKSPLRMPYQTASVEVIYGGGADCRPGEVSLAHNGMLLLDESAEFRSSVLGFLKAPMDSRTITLSRAGRSTVYPADFQLVMPTSPCPCGNYGVKDRICLCSKRAIERYWKKISEPVLSRIEIKIDANKEDTGSDMSFDSLRQMVRTAREIQRKRGAYNHWLSPQELLNIKTDGEAEAIIESLSEDMTVRQRSNILKVAVTIANMDGREVVSGKDVQEAVSYSELETVKGLNI